MISLRIYWVFKKKTISFSNIITFPILIYMISGFNSMRRNNPELFLMCKRLTFSRELSCYSQEKENIKFILFVFPFYFL